MTMDDKWYSKIARVLGGFITGVTFTPVIYHTIFKMKQRRIIKKNNLNLTIDEKLYLYLDETLMKLNLMKSVGELDLKWVSDRAIEIACMFRADRRYRNGKVIDTYWILYDNLNIPYKLLVDSLSRF